MGRIDEEIALQGFVVGREYSRPAIAALGGLPVPEEIYGTAWADGILQLQNAVLLFVTLEKEGEAKYLDVFDGVEFLWESQNRNTQDSPVIRKIAEGLPTYLFTRLRSKYRSSSKARPFVYCGRLGISAMDGSNPVTCLFESIDYQDNPGSALSDIYNWRPEVSTDSFEIRRKHLKGKRTRSTAHGTVAKYWRVAEAVEVLGRASFDEIDQWLAVNHPDDERSDLRENLAHLTVNSPSRVHYDKARKDWRSNSGHQRDRLFQVQGQPAIFEVYKPDKHGYVDLKKGADGKWKVMPLLLSDLEAAQGEALVAFQNDSSVIYSDHDARVQVIRLVTQRQGQPAFRARVLAAYGGACCVTGSNAEQVLEAAHIRPYKGPHTNSIDNALLLRSDIHTLFDLGLLWVNSELRIELSPALDGSEYASFRGGALRLPERLKDRPNLAYLKQHASSAQDRMESEWG